eukprot:c15939_g1_i1.p1 GENE.c15939_g1_i1~~c15939_g1_i1.p1  ORF type:complete len:935 (-),score=172.96 c15939_g1_i1:67-2844(-)
MIELRLLNLTENRITSQLPRLQNTPNLKELHLAANSFFGPLSGMSLSSQLVVLDAAQNELTGDLSTGLLGHLEMLQQLILRNNFLGGDIPDLSGLTNLVSLNLAENRLVGTIHFGIKSLAHLETIQLQNNQLTGELPPLEAATNLRQLIIDQNSLRGDLTWVGKASQLRRLQLFANNFSGTLPPSLNQLTELTVLNVCRNRFEGNFPTLDKTKLHVLLAHDNRFRGSIDSLPDAMFQHPNSTNGTFVTKSKHGDPIRPRYTNIILLSQNFFSCSLPKSKSYVGSQDTNWLFRMVGLGNAFDDDIPDWVHHSEQLARLLWVPRFQMYLWYIIIVVVSFCGTFPCLGITSRKLVRKFLKSMESSTHHERLFALFRTSIRVCLALTIYGFGLAGVYSSGAKLYKCGNQMLRISVVYLAESPAAEVAAAVMLVIFMLISVLSLYYIRLHDMQFSTKREAAKRRGSVRRLIRRLSATPGQGPRPTFYERLRVVAQILCTGVAWLCMMMVLGLPTAVFVLYLSLPVSEAWYSNDLLLRSFPWIASICLSVNSVYLVPVTCRTVCRWIRTQDTEDHGETLTRPQQKWSLRLILVSRAVLSVWLPVAVVVWMDQGCMQGWKRFWNECDDVGQFNVLFEGIPVLRADDVCSQRFQTGRCSRRVIETIAGLITKKMLFDMFLSPSMLFLYHKFQINGRLLAFECCFSWGPRSHVPIEHYFSPPVDPDIPIRSHVQHHIPKYRPPPGFLPSILNCCMGWLYSSDKFTTKMKRLGWQRTQKGVSSSTYALLTTSWLDAAFILGGMVPITLPIIIVTLLTHWMIIRGLTITTTHISPTAPPPLAFLAFSIMTQCGLASWFFYDNRLHGEDIVLWGSIATAILLCFSYFAPVPTQIRDRLSVGSSSNGSVVGRERLLVTPSQDTLEAALRPGHDLPENL